MEDVVCSCCLNTVPLPRKCKETQTDTPTPTDTPTQIHTQTYVRLFSFLLVSENSVVGVCGSYGSRARSNTVALALVLREKERNAVRAWHPLCRSRLATVATVCRCVPGINSDHLFLYFFFCVVLIGDGTLA